MNLCFILILFSLVNFCSATAPQFPDGLNLDGGVSPARLLMNSQLPGENVLVESSPERVVISFKDRAPAASRRLGGADFRENGNFPGKINHEMLVFLTTLEGSDPDLRRALNEPEVGKEYVVSGYGTGCALATLAAHVISNSIVRIDNEFAKSIKTRNVIKLVGFYPTASAGDDEFCSGLVDNLGIFNCFFFKAPRVLGRGASFPGISLDVIYTEYLWDNNKYICPCCSPCLLVTACVPPLIYLAIQRNILLFLPAAGTLSAFVISCLAKGNQLSYSSVETAYYFARENRQMYGATIPVSSLGRVSWGDVRRGLLSYVYRLI